MNLTEFNRVYARLFAVIGSLFVMVMCAAQAVIYSEMARYGFAAAFLFCAIFAPMQGFAYFGMSVWRDGV